jgi:hypothetical protein
LIFPFFLISAIEFVCKKVIDKVALVKQGLASIIKHDYDIKMVYTKNKI